MDKKNENNDLFDLEIDIEEFFKQYEYKGPLKGVYLNTSEIAELFDVSPRTVTRWERKGYIYKDAPNRWCLADVVRGLYTALRELLEECGGRL
jgi:hypothetical protein